MPNKRVCSWSSSFDSNPSVCILDDPLDRLIAQEDQSFDIPGLLGRLNPTSRQVIRDRFGFDGEGKTLNEVSQSIGKSIERVRQIQLEAIDRLRAMIS